jgi:ADP-ribose pyrophosphatase YjhB (NUDIX family)
MGGAVEIGDPPARAAVREAREAIGVGIRLLRLPDVLGGPDFEITCTGGDLAAYVTAVYEAAIVGGGIPAADDDEVSDVQRFTREQLRGVTLRSMPSPLLLPDHGVAWASGRRQGTGLVFGHGLAT